MQHHFKYRESLVELMLSIDKMCGIAFFVVFDDFMDESQSAIYSSVLTLITKGDARDVGSMRLIIVYALFLVCSLLEYYCLELANLNSILLLLLSIDLQQCRRKQQCIQCLPGLMGATTYDL
ncbi:hypothetical protein V8G54_008043 [Vigna mungo]|uniref:Uncharacterized protein n=1 Tax=Vigna mungo TaxID=3915 RepID=A0AAQ3P4H2_VIGMU